MAKVLSVVGARPQFVKAAPTSAAIRRSHEEVLVHTGQHYDDNLSSVFFDDLGIPEPDYNLGVGSAPHAVQTGEMMRRLDDVIERESPHLVLVYGDTNSTLAAALVAVKRDPLLAHVEAGLRSYNWEIPEEVNRVLTDHCADLLFVPSQSAADNLAAEGLAEGVHVAGDVQYDALLAARETAGERSTIVEEVGVADGEYVLATVHRPSNTDDSRRLEALMDGLATSTLPVVFPVHPRTEYALREHGLWADVVADETIRAIDAAGYLDFVRLLDGAERVATDSGGVQKEAFYLATRCITMRPETEWVETVECGWNVLVDADPAAIERELARTDPLPPRPSLYGDGNAAEAIRRTLDDELSNVAGGHERREVAAPGTIEDTRVDGR